MKENTRQEQTEDWIDYIINKAFENYSGREIVIWGSYEVSDSISDRLKEKYGIDIAFYVDSDSVKIDEKRVFSSERLLGKSDKYYVIIPLAFYQSIREKLIVGGYFPNVDYYYFSDCILQHTPEYYEDAHGNKIIGKYEGLKFSFSGFHSVVEIGDNVRFRNVSFFIHNNIKIVIGDNAQFAESRVYIHHSSEAEFGKDLDLEKVNIMMKDKARMEMKSGCNIAGLNIRIEELGEVVLNEEVVVRCTDVTNWIVREHAKLKIGNKGIFRGYAGNINLYKNTSLIIGKDFSINGNYRIELDINTSIFIGDDCMFSYDICMRGNDGHSIYNVATGENINSTYDISRDRKVVIGNHVWVGERAEILYNAQIGDGSIIGALSLVKGIIPNNCIAAGIPARVIKKNVAWSRKGGGDNILECGQEYIHYTREL